MSTQPLHVVVVGGGIGGLCLAQALKRAGVSVAVYERDRASTDRLEGYRIHINPAGCRALRDCLPPAAWEAFVATAGDPGGGFGFLTERLEELAVVDEEIMYPGITEGQYPVDRLTLRRLLLAGLDDVVHFDKKFERYERSAEGVVTAFFSDGTSAAGDVLVGADGAGSRVRQQYLPQAERVDTDATAVALKLPLTDRTRSWLPPRLAAGMNLIMAPDPWFLFTAVFDRGLDPAQILRGLVAEEDLQGLDQGPNSYVLCAFVSRSEAYPETVSGLSGEALKDLVGKMIEGWHPDLRWLIAEADPESAMVVPIRSSVPVEPWKTTNVTLLGDAIHSMPPTGGVGGNMALRDANLLGRKLAAVHRGESSLLKAIHEYEEEMVDYGFAAVRSSVEATRQGISSNPASLAAFKVFLRICQAAYPLKRLVFRNAWAEQARLRPWERDPPVSRARLVPQGSATK